MAPWPLSKRLPRTVRRLTQFEARSSAYARTANCLANLEALEVVHIGPPPLAGESQGSLAPGEVDATGIEALELYCAERLLSELAVAERSATMDKGRKAMVIIKRNTGYRVLLDPPQPYRKSTGIHETSVTDPGDDIKRSVPMAMTASR